MTNFYDLSLTGPLHAPVYKGLRDPKARRAARAVPNLSKFLMHPRGVVRKLGVV